VRLGPHSEEKESKTSSRYPRAPVVADRGLTPGAGSAIADPANEVFVSAAAGREVSTKKALGKLRAPDDLAFQLDQNGFRSLLISIVHGVAAGSLPRHHEDPFGRMLVAQALLEHLRIVTSDSHYAAYAVELLDA